MSIQEEVKKALARKDPPLSSKEALALRTQLFAALVEVTGRHSAIHPGEGNIPVGRVRRKALEGGTAQDVARLDDEFRELTIEKAQLEAKRDALDRARKEALVREAVEGLPKMQEEFVARLDAAEAAHRAFEEALDGLDASYNEIAQAHATVRDACMYGVQVAPDAAKGAEPSVIPRMMALAPFAKANRVIHHPDPSLHSSRLGAPEARTQAEWMERQYPTPRRWVAA